MLRFFDGCREKRGNNVKGFYGEMKVVLLKINFLMGMIFLLRLILSVVGLWY